MNFELICTSLISAAALMLTSVEVRRSDRLQGFGNSSAAELTRRNAKALKKRKALISRSCWSEMKRRQHTFGFLVEECESDSEPRK